MIGGWYYSLGGPIYSTVEVYDPVTNTWTSGIDTPVTIAGLSASVVDDKIYIMGGTTAPHDNEYWPLTSAVYTNEPIVDFNGDYIVDIGDLVILVDNWGTDESLCDIGPMPWGDSMVNEVDLEVLISHWGQDIRLAAHWKLDEAEGTIAYDSAGEHDGVLNGNPLWQPEGGMIDGAL